MTKNIVQTIKHFAQSERERLREHFAKRATEVPLVSPFNAASLRIWDEYVDEMRELELQMREAGDHL